ncbi:hypothetical protein BH23GEM7_BH23GEM7_08300 [soil metagenome]
MRAIKQEAEEVAVGSHEIFTRREIVELAFDVLGRPPQVRSLPP